MFLENIGCELTCKAKKYQIFQSDHFSINERPRPFRITVIMRQKLYQFSTCLWCFFTDHDTTISILKKLVNLKNYLPHFGKFCYLSQNRRGPRLRLQCKTSLSHEAEIVSIFLLTLMFFHRSWHYYFNFKAISLFKKLLAIFWQILPFVPTPTRATFTTTMQNKPFHEAEIVAIFHVPPWTAFGLVLGHPWTT